MSGLRREAESLVAGEFVLTADDFRRLAEMVHADAGIALTETKATLVYSRLARRLRALGLESFKAYCSFVGDVRGTDERQMMLAALTTNVTRFFREPHHFDHLKHEVLPPLLEDARRGGRVRVWSAGCSDGQEPFSIALTILTLMPDAADYDIKILASDIDPNVIAAGREAVYTDAAVAAIPGDLRTRWFEPFQIDGGKHWLVAAPARALVAFRELNLVGDWPMKGKFDAIFCRNVVIYFKEDTQWKIWSGFVPLLTPDGVLYIGHSERVGGPASPRLRAEGVTTYRLVSDEAAR